MSNPQPYNCVVFEAEVDGQFRHFHSAAQTDADDPFRAIWNELHQRGVTADLVRRIYSERQPSAEITAFIQATFPRAAVGWKYPLDACEEAVSEGLATDASQARPKPKSDFIPIDQNLNQSKKAEQK